MGLARGKAATRQGYLQRDPRYSDVMLPALERIFGCVPGPSATLWDRRQAVIARQRQTRGARYESIIEQLTLLLGDDFIYLRPIKDAEVVNTPLVLADSPGVFMNPGIPPKIFRILDPVAELGVPVTFRYATPFLYATGYGAFGADGIGVNDDGTRFVVGESACVNIENSYYSEKVAITAQALGIGYPTATAVFAKPHHPGDTIQVAHTPWWSSNRRHVIVVVTPRVARDADKRRQIHELMGRMMESVSYWEIAEPGTSGNLSEMTLGTTPLGTAVLGTFTEF